MRKAGGRDVVFEEHVPLSKHTDTHAEWKTASRCVEAGPRIASGSSAAPRQRAGRETARFRQARHRPMPANQPLVAFIRGNQEVTCILQYARLQFMEDRSAPRLDRLSRHRMRRANGHPKRVVAGRGVSPCGGSSPGRATLPRRAAGGSGECSGLVRAGCPVSGDGPVRGGHFFLATIRGSGSKRKRLRSDGRVPRRPSAPVAPAACRGARYSPTSRRGGRRDRRAPPRVGSPAKAAGLRGAHRGAEHLPSARRAERTGRAARRRPGRWRFRRGVDSLAVIPPGSGRGVGHVRRRSCCSRRRLRGTHR